MLALSKIKERRDVATISLQDEQNIVSSILIEQGLMQEGEETVIHDRVAFNKSLAVGEARHIQETQKLHEQLGKIDLVMQELAGLKTQIGKAPAQMSSTMQPTKPVKRDVSPVRKSAEELKKDREQRFTSPSRADIGRNQR